MAADAHNLSSLICPLSAHKLPTGIGRKPVIEIDAEPVLPHDSALITVPPGAAKDAAVGIDRVGRCTAVGDSGVSSITAPSCQRSARLAPSAASALPTTGQVRGERNPERSDGVVSSCALRCKGVRSKSHQEPDSHERWR